VQLKGSTCDDDDDDDDDDLLLKTLGDEARWFDLH
jgi:hypothetical protein